MYHYVENSANSMRISLPSYDILMTSRSLTYHYVEDSVFFKRMRISLPSFECFSDKPKPHVHYVEYSVFFKKDADCPTLL